MKNGIVWHNVGIVSSGSKTKWSYGSELKERELAVAAHEAAMFQCELEYRCLECCPMCGKRGQNDEAQGQRVRAKDGACRRED